MIAGVPEGMTPRMAARAGFVQPFTTPGSEELDEMKQENKKLRRRLMFQRKELRSLNKHLRYWTAIAKAKGLQQQVVQLEELMEASRMSQGLLRLTPLTAVAAAVVLAILLLLR